MDFVTDADGIAGFGTSLSLFGGTAFQLPLPWGWAGGTLVGVMLGLVGYYFVREWLLRIRFSTRSLLVGMTVSILALVLATHLDIGVTWHNGDWRYYSFNLGWRNYAILNLHFQESTTAFNGSATVEVLDHGWRWAWYDDKAIPPVREPIVIPGPPLESSP